MCENKFPEVPFKVMLTSKSAEIELGGMSGDVEYTVSRVTDKYGGQFIIDDHTYHHSHFNIIEEKKVTEQKVEQKFKVGDKVMIVGNAGYSFDDKVLGKCAKISKIYGSAAVDVDIDSHIELPYGNKGWCYESEHLQSIEEVKYKEHKFSVELWEKYKHHPDLKVSLRGKPCLRFEVMVNNCDPEQGMALFTIDDGEEEWVSSCAMRAFTLHIPVTAKRIPFDPERKDAKVFVKESYRTYGMPPEVDEWYAFADCSVACRIKGIGKEFFLQKHLEMEIEE